MFYICTINPKLMNTEAFKAWKEWYKKNYPEEFSMFNDKILYEIYSMNK